MKLLTISTLKKLLIIVLFPIMLSCVTEQQNDFSEVTKIALRDVGHKLLLSHQDSTSLVLPVIELEINTFQIEFSNPLSI